MSTPQGADNGVNSGRTAPPTRTNKKQRRTQRWAAAADEEKKGAPLTSGPAQPAAAAAASSEDSLTLAYYVSLFDPALPLGAFLGRSLLVDEYIVVVAYHYLLRSELSVDAWPNVVVFALMLAVQMHEDSDDYGYIELVKFWCEQQGHRVALHEGQANQFVIQGVHCDEFNRAKNELWHRLGFRLHVAPRAIASTLAAVKRKHSHIALPVRTEHGLDLIFQLRRDSALRLWVDRRVRPRARPPTRHAGAAATKMLPPPPRAADPLPPAAGKRKSDDMSRAPVAEARPLLIKCSPSKSSSASTDGDESESSNKRRWWPAPPRSLLCDEEMANTANAALLASGIALTTAVVPRGSALQPVEPWNKFFARCGSEAPCGAAAEDENHEANQRRASSGGGLFSGGSAFMSSWFSALNPSQQQ